MWDMERAECALDLLDLFNRAGGDLAFTRLDVLTLTETKRRRRRGGGGGGGGYVRCRCKRCEVMEMVSWRSRYLARAYTLPSSAL